MKKSILLLFTVASVLGLVLSSCASIKILTPGAIDSDIGDFQYLGKCQFFISKDVTLQFFSDDRRATSINETSGVAVAERVMIRRTIKIASSTPGILQTKNNAGDVLDGYFFWDNSGSPALSLLILFESDNDNAIGFYALYDVEDDKFELVGNTVNYGGLTYTVTYDGDERPYLKYKLLERTRKQNEARKAKGRRVGT
jgi:hypothetical protein